MSVVRNSTLSVAVAVIYRTGNKVQQATLNEHMRSLLIKNTIAGLEKCVYKPDYTFCIVRRYVSFHLPIQRISCCMDCWLNESSKIYATHAA